MTSFSQRKGIKPIKSIIQIDSMDDDLRNSLWNALQVFYWAGDPYRVAEQPWLELLLHFLWTDFFKKHQYSMGDNVCRS